jgi:perosamine synthetase
MLVTDREGVYQRAQVLRDHGRNPSDKMFWNMEIGYKYKMSNLQAALGLAQLERIDELIARKRQIFAWYKKKLAGVGEVTLNYEAKGTKNTYWMVTVVLNKKLGVTKEHLIALMAQRNIDCRPFFNPLSSLPAYEKLLQAQQARERNHVSHEISDYGINLPSALNMTEEKVKYVCDILKEVLSQK